jgi:hypothetical protein
VLTSIVTTESRLNRPDVSTVNDRVVPEGIGPPAPVKTVLTPGTAGSADSSTALFASSAIAATPWLAISPTLHTSACPEWTTKSGGESGCEPGAPGPGGVRFVIVTRQVFVTASSRSSSSAEAGPTATAIVTRAMSPSRMGLRMYASSYWGPRGYEGGLAHLFRVAYAALKVPR